MVIEIRLAKARGFCAGVERALNKVEEALKTGPFPVYVLHEIVHNETVVDGLRKRGVIFIDDPAEAQSGVLIFSAHGVSRAVEKQAAKPGVKVVDATCPIVKSLHRRMEQFAAAGKNIILFGRNGLRFSLRSDGTLAVMNVRNAHSLSGLRAECGVRRGNGHLVRYGL